MHIVPYSTDLQVAEMHPALIPFTDMRVMTYCEESWFDSLESGRLVYSVFTFVVQFVLPITLITFAHSAIKRKLQKLPSWQKTAAAAAAIKTKPLVLGGGGDRGGAGGGAQEGVEDNQEIQDIAGEASSAIVASAALLESAREDADSEDVAAANGDFYSASKTTATSRSAPDVAKTSMSVQVTTGRRHSRFPRVDSVKAKRVNAAAAAAAASAANTGRNRTSFNLRR